MNRVARRAWYIGVFLEFGVASLAWRKSAAKIIALALGLGLQTIMAVVQ
jgi:hypothetical protein